MENFNLIASKKIEELLEIIEDNFDIEADIKGEILYIYSANGEYVINKHAPTFQIWLSSPISGALHFVYNQDKKQWLDTKNQLNLDEILFEELKIS